MFAPISCSNAVDGVTAIDGICMLNLRNASVDLRGLCVAGIDDGMLDDRNDIFCKTKLCQYFWFQKWETNANIIPDRMDGPQFRWLLYPLNFVVDVVK